MIMFSKHKADILKKTNDLDVEASFWFSLKPESLISAGKPHQCRAKVFGGPRRVKKNLHDIFFENISI